ARCTLAKPPMIKALGAVENSPRRASITSQAATGASSTYVDDSVVGPHRIIQKVPKKYASRTSRWACQLLHHCAHQQVSAAAMPNAIGTTKKPARLMGTCASCKIWDRSR